MTDLFMIERQPLILELQDAGEASDDLLEIFLLRRGWGIERVHELQESISAKSTLDMFTGETEPLDASERDLQRAIDVYLKGIAARR